jgi:hypothetical protein
MAEPSEAMRDAVVKPSPSTEWWHAPAQFLIHAIVGTFIFTLIAFTAFGLHALVHLFEEAKLGNILVWGLRIAEYSLFLVDLALFLVFLWRTFRRTLREL